MTAERIFLLLAIFISVIECTFYSVKSGDDLWAVVNKLQPGDIVNISTGSWTSQQSGGGSWKRSVTLNGTLNQPIIIQAAPNSVVNITGDPAASQNVIDLTIFYGVFRGISFSLGSKGLRLMSGSHSLFENLEISETQDVGISMNEHGNVFINMTIRHCHIHHTYDSTADGMYLGCSNPNSTSDCHLQDCLIEYNWVHHIAQQSTSLGFGIQLKMASFNNIIRHNVVHDTHGPCIITYTTWGTGVRNIIDSNLMWNCGDNGIQATAYVTIRNNVILNNIGNAGISIIQNPAGAPVTDVTISQNTVLVTTGVGCLDTHSTNTGKNFLYINNIFLSSNTSTSVYAIRQNGASSTEVFERNGVVGQVQVGVGSYTTKQIFSITQNLNQLFQQVNTIPYNTHPLSSSELLTSTDARNANPDSTMDFDCKGRSNPIIGAYETTDGWTPVDGFQPYCTQPSNLNVANYLSFPLLNMLFPLLFAVYWMVLNC